MSRTNDLLEQILHHVATIDHRQRPTLAEHIAQVGSRLGVSFPDAPIADDHEAIRLRQAIENAETRASQRTRQAMCRQLADALDVPVTGNWTTLLEIARGRSLYLKDHIKKEAHRWI